jgi:hypothetical protein
MRKWTVACVVTSAVLGTAASASVTDEKLACVAAADAAQQQRAAGKLLAARASLQICSRDACPGLVRSDCTRWRAEVEASVPTIVLRAQDPRGQDLTDVTVWLDGVPIADRMDGLPIEIDPGQHALTCEHAGSKKLRQEIVVRTGDKNRTISLPFEDLEPLQPVVIPPSHVQGSGRPSAAAWIFTGLGVAAAGVGTYFLVGAIRDKNNLERLGCKPNCDPALVDGGVRKDDFATVAFGAAILSGGLATYFFLKPSKPTSTTLPAREVLVTPIFGGAFASWSEHF